MQAKEVRSEALKREYAITVDAASLKAQLHDRLKAMGGKVNIPGFRPGHVPMHVLEQRYGQSVMGEVLEQAVRQATQQLVKEKNLRPAMQPSVNVTNYSEDGPLEFSVTMEILPDVPKMDFASVTVEKPTFTVDEKDVNEGLERLATRNRKPEPKDAGAKAAKGDAVLIDFVGKLDGVAFDGGSAKQFTLELGSNQFIPGFEDQLIGKKAGEEVVVKVSFPADYHKADLAGKPTEFDVTVHQVLGFATPAIDDSFASDMGFKDLETLKEAVRNQIRSDYDGVARSRMKKQLFDRLEEMMQFDVPESMVELEFKSIWEKLQEAKNMGDPTLDKPEEELKTEYRKISERRVRLGILLADVGRANNIQVTREELSKAVIEQARMFPGQEKKVFEFYRANPEHIEDLRGPILEEKAVDFLLSQVKLQEKTVTLDELMATEEDEATASEKPAKASKKKK